MPSLAVLFIKAPEQKPDPPESNIPADLLLCSFNSSQSIDIRAVCLDLGSYGNRSTRFRDFVVGICESREY